MKPGCFCGNLKLELRYVKATYSVWECLICRSQMLDPQPTDEVLSEIYNVHYSWLPTGPQASALKNLSSRQFLSQLPPGDPDHDRLLDVGAGRGDFCVLAREHYDVFASELSAFGAKCCRRIMGDDHVFEGQFESSRELDGKVDQFKILTMIDFIEHVRDPKIALGKARELLVGDGYLMIVTPQMNNWLTRITGRRWPHYLPEHLFYFSSRGIEMLLRKTGFVIDLCQRSKKFVTLRYILLMFIKNAARSQPSKLLSLLLRLPGCLLDFRLRIWTGDMLVIARRARD